MQKTYNDTIHTHTHTQSMSHKNYHVNVVVQVKRMFHLTDVSIGTEKTFYNTIVPLMQSVVADVLEDFLISVHAQLKNRQSVGVIIDGGWSHPGWWAREHTVIALDDETGLPLAYVHVLKGVNYNGSSRGM